ncbi:tectonin beta-propeller repeat-containing protein 1-like isoform X2 [Stegodyphus dumicola]|nr:tectonin beta-propeller repeat-containing protein 1-like isoform X2 [Stegodyphus dumicola]
MLLPTDRPQWSNMDGLASLPKENFHLPSKSWEWEGDWYVEDNLEGQPLEPEGWTYAADFPATYGPNKSWNSCVRRRKWIRYRRFCATNKWSLIPSIHEDPVLEPFIDVSVNGTEIPGGESNNFAVWAVTIMGRVIFRYGVTEISPEGSGWVPIKTPEECDVNQISVGPTGLVWAITWSGSAIVRIGVTRENIMGSHWIKVEPPSPEDLLSQVSVGKNVVWAISKDNKVWFRKGINGLHSGENADDATGSGWIEMFGTLANLSVGVNDQVFSISADARNIQLRTGINDSELCGRTWKVISAPLKLLHHSSSFSSLDSLSILSHKDSLYTSDSFSSSSRNQSFRKKSGDSVISCPPVSKCEERSECSILESNLERSESSSNSKLDSDLGDIFYKSEKEVPNIDEDLTHSHSPSHMRFDSICNRTSSYCSLDGSTYTVEQSGLLWHAPTDVDYQICADVMWVWISGSGCTVISETLPNWFSEGGSVCKSAVDEPWFNDVLSQLKDRYTREMLRFSSYPKAVEKSTWVKTVTCRWYNNNSWVTCLLELLQCENVNKSTLTCHHKKDQVVIQLTHITCVACLPDWNKNVLAIHTAKRTSKGSPYKFSFTSNDDLEEWLSTLNASCRNVNSLPWIPDKKSIWSLTVTGDVYVYCANSADMEKPIAMKWSLLGGGHLRLVETCPFGVTWGLGYNCTAWVYSGGFGGGPYHGAPGCNTAVGPMSDVRCLYIYENQRWNPLSGFTAKGLPTDRYMWSDQTGRVECTKDNTHLPSGHWQWISDWCIDYKTPGGVDNEGWQYATDFPRSYHGYKRFTDYVRRRRWYRKCRLTTSGPWQQLGNTPLLDVSFQVDSCCENDSIAVWAVAINGDVLYRVGVSESCPKGENWIHVPTEKSFCSISVGGDGAVWAIAKDGSAQLRHGITSSKPTGQYWCHVEPPQVGSPLRQISAGRTRVFAVDESCRLWSRQEIVPIFKEGTHWKWVSDDVKQVSVGPMDQVWCIKNNFVTLSGVISGVVCKRCGITEENPCGTDWEQGIGGCWNHVTIRGCLFEQNKNNMK